MNIMNIMKFINRYEFIDKYVLEELKVRYLSSDQQGKLALLKELNDNGYQGIPYEIALLALEDQNTEIRLWFAKNSKDFDYTETEHKKVTVPKIEEDDDGYEYVKEVKYPDRDLKAKISNDSNEIVQAAILENPNEYQYGLSFGSCDAEQFNKLNKVEKLAYVRNQNVPYSIIEQIFSSQDKEINVSLGERRELMLAYCTNPIHTKEPEDISKHHDDLTLGGNASHYDYETGAFYKHHCEKLWELISNWDDSDGSGIAGIQKLIFNRFPIKDYNKGEIYKKCKWVYARSEILESCKDGRCEAIKLGLNDEDEWCKQVAHGKVSDLTDEEFNEKLKSTDTDVLWGLSANDNLSYTRLEKLQEHLREVNKNIDVTISGEFSRWGTLQEVLGCLSKTIERAELREAILNNEEFQENLQSMDINILCGLSLNENLSVEQLNKVQESINKFCLKSDFKEMPYKRNALRRVQENLNKTIKKVELKYSRSKDSLNESTFKNKGFVDKKNYENQNMDSINTINSLPLLNKQIEVLTRKVNSLKAQVFWLIVGILLILLFKH